MTRAFAPISLVALFAALLLTSPALTSAEETKPAAAPAAVTAPAAVPVASPAPPTEPKASPVTPVAETKPAVSAVAAPELKVADTAKKESVVRIGYVDMTRFAGGTTMGKESRAKLEEKSDEFRTRITTKKNELEKQQATLQKLMPTLDQKQRESKAKAFEKKVNEYQKQVQNAEKELQSLEEELTRKLYKEIEKASGTYGKENGFAAIVVKKDLLYVGSVVESKDVTDEVLELVNSAGKKP